MDDKITIEVAEQSDISQLRTLWKYVFGDEDWYLDLFFDNIFRHEDTLVAKCENKVVSMMYMIPYRMRINTETYDIMYLYALATDKSYRGKGIMSELIRRSEQIVEERGYLGSFLIPAKRELYEFYMQRGFSQSVGRKGCNSQKHNTVILNEKQKFVNFEVMRHENQMMVNEERRELKGLFRVNNKDFQGIDIGKMGIDINEVLT